MRRTQVGQRPFAQVGRLALQRLGVQVDPALQPGLQPALQLLADPGGQAFELEDTVLHAAAPPGTAASIHRV